MATSTLPRIYRPGGVVSFHARGPHAAAARRLDGDVPLTVVPMPIAELRQYDWLIDVLREEGYHGDIVGGNVYFADTGAFLGCFFGDGRRVHVEWWDDVTLNDLEFVAEVRTAQIALNYMVNRWDSAHGRVLPVREPWESDESLDSRRRAVLEAHTVAGRPAPSGQTLADAVAKAEAEAAERERAEAKRRADYLAAVKERLTPSEASVRPVDRYTHTTTDQETGEAVHHVVVYTFAHLYDEEGAAHHFTARKDRGGVLTLDQGRTEETFWLHHRAIEALYEARKQRCQPHGWCHAFCRRAQPEGGPLAFCSSPQEIAAEILRRWDEV
ncbi:hypothetical protein [Streptomyces sp. NPDC002547]